MTNWKDVEEMFMDYVKVLSQNLPGGNWRNQGKQNIRQDIRCSGRDSNQASDEYNLETLPPEPTWMTE